MEFELIWLDGWLNWPRGNIVRQDSEAKSLQIQRNLLENTQNHPPQKTKNVQTSENRFFPKNVKSQWDFLTNRELELIYKARQMRNLEVIWYLFLYLFYVSSRPRPISEKLVFKPFCYGWTLILK